MQITMNENSDIFVAKVSHINGQYRLSVHKEKCELIGGIAYYMYYPFDEGNFCDTLFVGRKSQKKLDKINALLEENKQAIFDFWKEKQYQKLVDFVKQLVQNM